MNPRSTSVPMSSTRARSPTSRPSNPRISFPSTGGWNRKKEDGGTGLEMMHFWYWVMLRPSIGKGIMITNAEFNATTG